MGNKLSQLFLELEQKFDIVLVDTAPIAPVTDAYIISPLCDIVLYLIRSNHSPKHFVKQLNTNTKSLGKSAIVFNGIKDDRFGQYGYYGQRKGYVE